MTLEEFLVKLEGTKNRYWRLGASGALRCGRYNDDCVISVVLGDPDAFAEPRKAARTKLNMQAADATAIVHASDNYAEHDPALRSKLLAAVGIKEGE